MDLFWTSGLLIGAGYGYVAQRGAFCLNSGVRLLVNRGDATKVKAFLLAVAIQLTAVPWLLQTAADQRPPFLPAGALIGGLVFGLSMPLAAGCAGGVWYKLGAGNVGALAAVVGMGTGALVVSIGPMSPLTKSIQGLGTSLAIELPREHLPLAASAAGLLLGGVLLRSRVTSAGDWTWRRTGLLLGALGVMAWPASSLASRPFGMAVLPGTTNLMLGAIGAPGQRWDVLLVLGIPLGALAAAGRQRFSLAGTRPGLLVQRMLGGLGLGAGGTLAAGCTVGHGMTGTPLLAAGSISTMAAIFAGAALSAKMGWVS